MRSETIMTHQTTMTRQMPNDHRPRSARAYRPLAAMILALTVWAQAARPAAADTVNRIILRVNEEILTLHEFEMRKASEISGLLANQRLSSDQRQERLGQVGRAVMQNSFSEMLLLSFANQRSIRITDSEVEEAVRDLLTRQGIENDDQLQQALAGSGMTLDDLRANTKRELLWQQVVGSEVRPRVDIGEEELRAYYRSHQDEFRVPEQRWLKEIIVLESSGLEDAELKRVAEEIRAKLAGGDDPAAVVESYKEKEITTGVVDLDWLRAEELESSLSDAAWALAPGDYSPPVAARGGYHILHVAGLREAKLRPLEEVQDFIMRREYGKRFDIELRNFLAELEQHSYIHEDLPEEAVGYRAMMADFQPEDEIELFRAPVLEPPEEDEPEEEGTPAEGASDGRR